IFSDDDEEFYWPLPTEPYYPPDPIIPQNFVFVDGPDYEVFNIESIDNDQDVIEVGVFAGNTCVGASVFTGEYPLQILAYTNASHSEEVISFAIHRSARGEDSNIRTVELLDAETGEYYEEILQPQAKRIATLRLGADDEIEEVIKPQFTLSQNYPNPIVMSQVSRSSELTKIDFSLPEAAEVSLNIYNIKGQLVKTLASGELSAGRHTVSWDGNNVNNQSVGSGVYFYRLDNGKKTINRKMLIIK
ncbi:MAG: FlgD immunoglobulin-like domain containing protein, partial [Candidatus Cloacimonadia bacterium]